MSTPLHRSQEGFKQTNSDQEISLLERGESTSTTETQIITPNRQSCFVRNRYWIIIGLISFTAILIGQRAFVYILKQFFEWVQSIGFWGNVMFVVMFFIVSFPFVLGGYLPLTLGAGSLYGVLYGTITVSIGSTFGGIAAYWICKKLTERYIDMSALKSSSQFHLFTNILKASDHTFLVTLLARWAPIPFGLQNIFFVLADIPFRDFFFVTWIGLLPLQILYTYFGATLRSLSKIASGEAELDDMQKISIVFQIVVIVGLVSYFVYLSKRAQRLQAQQQQNQTLELETINTVDLKEEV